MIIMWIQESVSHTYLMLVDFFELVVGGLGN